MMRLVIMGSVGRVEGYGNPPDAALYEVLDYDFRRHIGIQAGPGL